MGGIWTKYLYRNKNLLIYFLLLVFIIMLMVSGSSGNSGSIVDTFPGSFLLCFAYCIIADLDSPWNNLMRLMGL